MRHCLFVVGRFIGLLSHYFLLELNLTRATRVQIESMSVESRVESTHSTLARSLASLAALASLIFNFTLLCGFNVRQKNSITTMADGSRNTFQWYLVRLN
jgi:hypothetical protein